MKITAERLPESQMLLNVEIEEAELEQHKERAYRRLVQRATVPGFRKGKAPRRIFEQFYGPQTLLREALDTLLPETTAKAIEQQALEAIGQPTIEIQGLEPVTYKATVPLKPTLKLGDYASLRVPWEEPTVTEEQVTGVLERLRADSTPWEPAERPLQMGDMTTLHLRGAVLGLTPEEMAAFPEREDLPTQPGERLFLKEEDWTYYPRPESAFPAIGFADQILGMQKGESREFTLALPADYSISQVAGKECRFSVVLKEVKEQRLPEMDDEWAKGVGDGYASLAELRQKVQEDLTARAQQQARQEYEMKVLEQLIGGASLEYPPILVEHEVEHLLQDQQQRLSSLGLDLERYFAITQRNQEEVVEELRAEAKRRVANTLVLNDLARVEGLEATPEEEEEEIGRLTSGEATPERREQVQRLFSTPEAREPLRRAVLSRKTMERLVQIARGEKAAQPSAEKPEEGPAEDAAKAAVEERSGAS